MLKYILVRIFLLFVAILMIITVIFFVSHQIMLMKYSPYISFMDGIRIIVRDYKILIEGIFTRWDWGLTTRNKNIWELLVPKAALSMKINLYSFLFYVPTGIIFGIISALKKNKATDHLINVFIMLFSSLHSLILIFLLMYIFGNVLDWLPTQYPPLIASRSIKTLEIGRASCRERV